MNDKIKECQAEIYRALMGTGKSHEIDEIIKLSLEILWVEAQKDFLLTNPPRTLQIKMDN